LKYGYGQRSRRNKMPYMLLNEESVVVQVGAPADTLKAGRSRAMHFALLARHGRVVVVEPDGESAALLQSICQAKALANVSVHEVGGWSSKKRLKLYVDPSHPATNFTEGMTDYDERRLQDFQVVEVEVDTLDNILTAEDLTDIDLLSITTNGAEKEILAGLEGATQRKVRHIALARTGVVDDAFMASLGYEKIAFDDRGFTYRSLAQKENSAQAG